MLLVLRFRPAWLGRVGVSSWQADTTHAQPRQITGQAANEQRITEAPYSDDPEVGEERDERRSDEESALRPLYHDE